MKLKIPIDITKTEEFDYIQKCKEKLRREHNLKGSTLNEQDFKIWKDENFKEQNQAIILAELTWRSNVKTEFKDVADESLNINLEEVFEDGN
jgi:hypothetical protein